MPQAAAARYLHTVRNFQEVGLHQCPSERKGEVVPVRRLHTRSHVPSHPQTAAKVRGFSLTASGFTAETDWLLEGDEFEPSVPQGRALVCLQRGSPDSPLEEGVSSEPVSEPKFPPSWENTGNFIDLGLGDASTVAKNVIQSVPYGPIPYAS
jgi:hypothetical protein